MLKFCFVIFKFYGASLISQLLTIKYLQCIDFIIDKRFKLLPAQSSYLFKKITIQKVFIRLVPEAGHDPETSEEVVWDAELAEGVDEHHPAQDEQEAGVGDADVDIDKLFAVVAPDK